MGDNNKIQIFTISIIVVITGLDLGEVSAHNRLNPGNNEKSQPLPSQPLPVANSVDSMKIVNELCATTTYKDVCFKNFIPLATDGRINSPQDLFRSAVKLALDETAKASNLPSILLPKATTKIANSALESCKELLEQSVDRLTMATDQVAVGDLSMILKNLSIKLDLRLELTDVNTFSTSCLDELGEVEAPELQQVIQDGINNAKELSVDLLDIVSTYNF